MRMLLILLIVVCSFSFPAMADDDDQLYIGQWITTWYDNDESLHFTIFDLQEDGDAICIFGTANNDPEKIKGRSYIGSWRRTYKGAHIKTGNYAETDVFLTDNDFLAEGPKGYYTVYSRIPEYDTNDTTNGPVSISFLETGVQIPTGTYVIGDDIPAGVYRFEMNKAMSYVEYYDNQSALLPSTDFTLSTRSTVYARLKLEDGGVLKITNSSIILSYAKSLFTE